MNYKLWNSNNGGEENLTNDQISLKLLIRDKISHLIKFLAIMGPAWLVMIADVDVASIITGIESGAQFKYSMIFIELILIIPLFIIQDAAGRVGVVTQKGIGELILENYGKKTALVATVPMAITDFLSYLVEYFGIAFGFELLGIPIWPYIVIVFVLHLLIVMTRSYKSAERILMLISGFFVLFVIYLGVASKPDYSQLMIQAVSPLQPYSNSDFTFLIIANIGAVIMPWMLFFQAGAVAEKKLDISHLHFERIETFIGAIVSEVLMVGMILVGISLGDSFLTNSSLLTVVNGISLNIIQIFGLAFVFSGFLALIIISLGSSWGVVESLGYKRQSKENLLIYTLESFPALLLTLLITISIDYMIGLMVLFVFVLLIPGILLGVIVQNKKIMKNHNYNKKEITIYWSVLIMIEVAGFIGVVMAF